MAKLPKFRKMIKTNIAQNIFEPLYAKAYVKDNRLNYYNFIKKAQWNTLQENEKIQAQKLYQLIKYASKNIPYYKKIVKKEKINFSESTIFKDMRKFPLMTKEIVKKEFNSLYKIQKGMRWYYRATSGTTEKPLRFIQDYSFQGNHMAMFKLQYEWSDVKLGERLIELLVSRDYIAEQKKYLSNRFANWMYSISVLDALSLNHKKKKLYAKKITKGKPRLIVANPESIFELSKFIKKSGFKVHPPKAIKVVSGILYPHMRKEIESVFGCPVFDIYGARECGIIAGECEEKRLHQNVLHHYVEILNKDNIPCREGEVGEIYVTLLTNFAMPLIRYRLRDLAIYTKSLCACGRGLPLFDEIVGRDSDVFKTKDGRIIPGKKIVQIITESFPDESIGQFQIIQRNYNLFEVKINIKNRLNSNKKKSLVEDLIGEIVGEVCRIKWVYTSTIKATQSGKYRFTLRDFDILD